MNRLQAELRRLYRLGSLEDEGHSSEDSGLISPDGGVRAMVLELARPADWTALSTLWHGVQVDLELPAPAIAVSGIDGYQLWFSLSAPVPVVDARSFLESLRQRYLGHIAPGRVAVWPAVDTSVSGHGLHAKIVPALWEGTGRWSAFIAPDLAAVFSDEPWLDICPSPDAQADILSRLVSIKAEDFQMALGRLSAADKTPAAPTALAADERGGSKSDPDPKRFLLDVMGDKTIELHLRIQAAQALLPYFESRPHSAT
jgi:hypothetical protein